MKKIFKFISISLVCVFSLITSFGCSCSKKIDAQYTVDITASDMSVIKEFDSYTNIFKKFREPADTPCYKKTKDGYELIEKAAEVSKCYDAEGNKFEKATISKADKVLVESEVSLFTQDSPNTYTSKVRELPSNKNRSFVYYFYFYNGNKNEIYIKTFDVRTIANNQIKDSSLLKVNIVDGENAKTTLNGEEYYIVGSGDTACIIVEVKGFTKKDVNKGVKTLNLNIPIVIIKL